MDWLVSRVTGFFRYVGSILYFIRLTFRWLFTRKPNMKSLAREILAIGVNSPSEVLDSFVAPQIEFTER